MAAISWWVCQIWYGKLKHLFVIVPFLVSFGSISGSFHLTLCVLITSLHPAKIWNMTQTNLSDTWGAFCKLDFHIKDTPSLLNSVPCVWQTTIKYHVKECCAKSANPTQEGNFGFKWIIRCPISVRIWRIKTS